MAQNMSQGHLALSKQSKMDGTQQEQQQLEAFCGGTCGSGHEASKMVPKPKAAKSKKAAQQATTQQQQLVATLSEVHDGLCPPVSPGSSA